MQLHAIKYTHYKVIKTLAVRWFGTKLMQISKKTTISDKSYPGGPLEVGTNWSVPQNDVIVSTHLIGHRMSMEEVESHNSLAK